MNSPHLINTAARTPWFCVGRLALLVCVAVSAAIGAMASPAGATPSARATTEVSLPPCVSQDPNVLPEEDCFAFENGMPVLRSAPKDGEVCLVEGLSGRGLTCRNTPFGNRTWQPTPGVGAACLEQNEITADGLGCHEMKDGSLSWMAVPANGAACFSTRDEHGALWCVRHNGKVTWRTPIGIRCEVTYERYVTFIFKTNEHYTSDDFLCAKNARGKRVWQRLPVKGAVCHDRTAQKGELECATKGRRLVWRAFPGLPCTFRDSVRGDSADSYTCLRTASGKRMTWQVSPNDGVPCVRRGATSSKTWRCSPTANGLVWVDIDPGFPARLPEDSPVQVPGSTLFRYEKQNVIQAELWMMPDAHVRSWSFDLPAYATAKEQQAAVRQAVRQAGAKIHRDGLRYDTELLASWKGIGLSVRIVGTQLSVDLFRNTVLVGK